MRQLATQCQWQSIYLTHTNRKWLKILYFFFEILPFCIELNDFYLRPNPMTLTFLGDQITANSKERHNSSLTNSKREVTRLSITFKAGPINEVIEER